MLDVIVALLPALMAGCFYFGARAAVVVLTAVVSCVAAEFIYQLINRGIIIKNKESITFKEGLLKSAGKTDVGDFSAVVTGILLGLNLPAGIPLWMVVAGSVFAIVIVKQLFGGLGHNFVNPALAARAFMLASWPVAMTSFAAPVMSFTAYIGADAVSSATPLEFLKNAEAVGRMPSIYELFIGRVGGCIGETSAVLILLGGIYLLINKVIDWRIPVCYLGSFAVLVFLFGQMPYSLPFVLYNLFAGGLMLGAFFMATDYVTTPTTARGHVIFGIGCGVLTFAIRRFGAYPEGATYAILLMNIVSPLIDRYVRPKKFGEVKAA